MSRICIYPKDIQNITGVSDRQSRRIIQTIKKRHQKLKYQSVTIQEFCDYKGLQIVEVRAILKIK